ncbi:MAG: hypothetical protein RIS92_698, partial [Verrucomicrobiota bacterium]
ECGMTAIGQSAHERDVLLIGVSGSFRGFFHVGGRSMLTGTGWRRARKKREHARWHLGCAKRGLAANLEQVSDDFSGAKLDEVLVALPVEGLIGDGVAHVESFVGVSSEKI